MRPKRKTLTYMQKKAMFAKMRRNGMLYVSDKTARVNRHGKRLDIDKDRKRKALKPGKRTSYSGNTYWENRANRADVNDYDRRKKFKNRKIEWL